jgi:hypothetical protein
MAHINLGSALRKKGEYVAALAEFRRGHELGSKRPGWAYPSAEGIDESEQFVALVPRLSAVLKGEDHPADAAERVAFGQMAYYAQRYAASARLYAGALESDPTLADDLKAGHRYNAACSAALAAAGTLDGEPPPADVARTKLQRQAREWLRADLVLVRRQLDAQNVLVLVRREILWKLRHWKIDADLDSVREPQTLKVLTTEEQQAWRDLWGDVDALLTKAQSGP